MTADIGHSNPGTVVDLEISGSALVVSWTGRFPPGTYTLSGVITSRCDGQESTTDNNGAYSISLNAGENDIWVIRNGYDVVGPPPTKSCEHGDAIVEIDGDTTFDIELAGEDAHDDRLSEGRHTPGIPFRCRMFRTLNMSGRCLS